MSKIKEKYSAEVIILIIVLVMVLTSCRSNYCPYTCSNEKPIKCCVKDTNHPLWECGEDIEYKYSELITN